MSKNATVSARVEEQVKTEAEHILDQLGIPVSVVINSLYRQIIYQQGIPFPLRMPPQLRTADSLTPAALNSMLQHSYEQASRGEGQPVSDVFGELLEEMPG